MNSEPALAATDSAIRESAVVIGLGYVGLPVALGFARVFRSTVGFDISQRRVTALRAGEDSSGEVSPETLHASPLTITDDTDAVRGASFYIVTVPTPIDTNRQPDLQPLRSACDIVGRGLVAARQPIVCFESTVYPGVTEEFCGPLLEKASGLVRGRDFKLAYSPERINPGDPDHKLESIKKVVAAEDAESLQRVASAYGAVVTAGIHRAPSIKVAEAAKVIENTQRDLNIALMNELALICERLGIRTRDVLDAAATKWNFLRFAPGLVGGHCIGVDPYYLTSKAESLGYHPEVILAGRRINDGMGTYCAQRMVKALIAQDIPVKGARVGVLGLTFKENVADVRNSRVPDIVAELRNFGIEAIVHDPVADRAEASAEYGIQLRDEEVLRDLHGLMLAVPHRGLVRRKAAEWSARLRRNGVFADIKSVYSPQDFPSGQHYWSL